MSIILVHEFGHLFAALVLRWKIDKIYVYPLGGIVKFNESINRNIIEEFFVVVSGPIFQIIYSYILFSLQINNCLFFSNLLLCYNLLPIYPLDGGKICNMIFSYFFSYKISFFISVLISFIFFVFSFIYFVFCLKNYFFIFVFFSLFFKLIDEVNDYAFLYNKFLLERYLFDFKFSRFSYSKDVFSFYRNRKHFLYKDGIMISESRMLNDYFK